MATYTSVHIANLALQMLGQDPITALADTPKRAREINTCYDLLREAELRLYPWAFAIYQAQLVSDLTPPGWGRANRFALPTGYMRLLPRYPEDNYSSTDWLVEAGYIVTDDNENATEKDAVRVATTAAVTLASDLENGDTIDGVVLATGDRILVKDQASAAENGVYTVNSSGAPTRATDFDATSGIKFGWYVDVTAGTTNAGRTYIVSTNDTIVVGTTALTFAQTSATPATLFIRYLKNVTDVDAMDPLFRLALAGKIAEQTCEAITQSNTKAAGATERYDAAISKAKRVGAIEKPGQLPPVDGFIQARDSGLDYSRYRLRT